MAGLLTVERIMALVLAAIAFFIFSQTTQFPRLAQQVEMLGPGFLPNLTAGILLVFSFILALKKGQRPLALNAALKDNLARILIVIYLVVYIWLMPLIGFIASTAALLFGLFWTAGFRQPVKALGLALATTLVIYFVFSSLLEISFPAGILI